MPKFDVDINITVDVPDDVYEAWKAEADADSLDGADVCEFLESEPLDSYFAIGKAWVCSVDRATEI